MVDRYGVSGICQVRETARCSNFRFARGIEGSLVAFDTSTLTISESSLVVALSGLKTGLGSCSTLTVQYSVASKTSIPQPIEQQQDSSALNN